MRFLKRFPESKHEQIKQLMNYIQLCGVTGKDLVSIGGYIDRSRKSADSKVWIERVKAYNPMPIGQDARHKMNDRFKLKNMDGKGYTFVSDGWGGTWTIISNSTQIRKTHNPKSRDWPSHIAWTKRGYYDMILDISDGDFKLDF